MSAFQDIGGHSVNVTNPDIDDVYNNAEKSTLKSTREYDLHQIKSPFIVQLIEVHHEK